MSQMSQTVQTDSVRINKEILDRIRFIAKMKGQTLSGYINLNLAKVVNKDWEKTYNKLEKSNI